MDKILWPPRKSKDSSVPSALVPNPNDFLQSQTFPNQVSNQGILQLPLKELSSTSLLIPLDKKPTLVERAESKLKLEHLPKDSSEIQFSPDYLEIRESMPMSWPTSIHLVFPSITGSEMCQFPSQQNILGYQGMTSTTPLYSVSETQLLFDSDDDEPFNLKLEFPDPKYFHSYKNRKGTDSWFTPTIDNGMKTSSKIMMLNEKRESASRLPHKHPIYRLNNILDENLRGHPPTKKIKIDVLTLEHLQKDSSEIKFSPDYLESRESVPVSSPTSHLVFPSITCSEMCQFPSQQNILGYQGMTSTTPLYSVSETQLLFDSDDDEPFNLKLEFPVPKYFHSYKNRKGTDRWSTPTIDNGMKTNSETMMLNEKKESASRLPHKHPIYRLNNILDENLRGHPPTKKIKIDGIVIASRDDLQNSRAKEMDLKHDGRKMSEKSPISKYFHSNKNRKGTDRWFTSSIDNGMETNSKTLMAHEKRAASVPVQHPTNLTAEIRKPEIVKVENTDNKITKSLKKVSFLQTFFGFFRRKQSVIKIQPEKPKKEPKRKTFLEKLGLKSRKPDPTPTQQPQEKVLPPQVSETDTDESTTKK